MTAPVLEKVRETVLDTSNEDAQATHIVLIPPHLRGKVSPQAYVMAAMVEGVAIEALCGHTWIPSRDPKKFPICEPCKAVYEDDPNGKGDRGELPDA